MKKYEIRTIANTEVVEALSLDESDLHVVRLVLPGGKRKSYGRGTLISCKEVEAGEPAMAEAKK